MPRVDTQQQVVAAAIEHMEKIDPMAIIIMTAAGTAGLAGRVGPLTSILNAFTEGEGVASLPSSLFGFTGPGIVYNFITMLLPPSQTSTTTNPPDPAAQAEALQRVGYAASNIVEAGLLYTLLKNDEVLRAAIDATKTAVGNVTKLPAVLPV